MVNEAEVRTECTIVVCQYTGNDNWKNGDEPTVGVVVSQLQQNEENFSSSPWACISLMQVPRGPETQREHIFLPTCTDQYLSY